MKNVSRSIIYKEKESISFFLGEGDTLERDFIYKLRKRPFMQELDDASVNILRLFNNACYICTLVYEGDYPLLDLKEYEKVAIDGHDDSIWTNHIFPATMALVVIWLKSRESKKILTERGQQKNIEDLCKGICVNVEENDTLPDEGIEDFRTLISDEHRFPSGFVSEKCFLRRPLAETVEDRSVKFNDIMDSLGFLADAMTNPEEFLAAFGPGSFFAKGVPKEHFNSEEKLRELWEWLNKKFKDDNELPPAGASFFTTRQIAIIAYALCKRGNIIPKNKKSIAPMFNKLTGRSVNVLEQNLCSTYSDEEIEKIAASIENDMPEFAKYIREKTFFLPEITK